MNIMMKKIRNKPIRTQLQNNLLVQLIKFKFKKTFSKKLLKKWVLMG